MVLLVCHQRNNFGDCTNFDSEDLMFQVNSRNYIFEGFYGFMGEISAQYVTTLPFLVTITVV